MKEEKKFILPSVKKYLFWAVVILLLIFSFFIIRQFMIALISSFVLSFLIRPLYLKLESHTNKHLAAGLCIALIALIILIPAALLAKEVIQQTASYKGEIPFNTFVAKLSSLPLLKFIDLEAVKEKVFTTLFSLFTASLKQAPAFILGIVITLFAMYYILVYWTAWSSHLQSYIPFTNKKRVAQELALATKNIVYGYFFIALIELTVAFIGFSLAGVKFALLFAILIALLAFVPGLGPLIIWAPLTLAYIFIQEYPTAIGIAITGLIISLLIDQFLAIKIVANKTKINPLLLLLGILGGVPLFGIFGFIIGPLILVYTLKLLQEAMHQAS